MCYEDRMNELMDQLNKAIASVNKLDYFKNELLKILDAKEKHEDALSKSIQDYFDDINKSLFGIGIEKGRVGTIGEIRTWKDGKRYKKMPNGKWVRVYQQHDRSAEISIARLKGKVKNAKSVDELMNIVMSNIHRFEDENGQVLPIVEELKKEVAAGKLRLNAGKPSTKEQIEKFKKEREQKENNPVSMIDYLHDRSHSRKEAETKAIDLLKAKIKDIPDDKIKVLDNACKRNNALTSEYGLENCTVNVFPSGIEYSFEGTRANASLYVKNDGEFARKKSEDKLYSVYFKSDRVIDFREIKKRAAQIGNNAELNQTSVNNSGINFETDLPMVMKKGKWGNQFKALVDSINNHPDANPDVIQLFKNMSKMNMDVEMKISKQGSKKGTENGEFRIMGDRNTLKPTTTTLFIPDDIDNKDLINYNGIKTVHELTHMIAFFNRGDKDFYNDIASENVDFCRLVENTNASKDSIDKIKSKINEFYAERKTGVSKVNELNKKIVKITDDYHKGFISYDEYSKQYDELKAESEKERYELKKITSKWQSWCTISDMYDALSGGNLYDSGYPGHGRKYYKTRENQAKELLANYAALSIYDFKILDGFKKEFPEITNSLDGFIKNMNEKMRG